MTQLKEQKRKAEKNIRLTQKEQQNRALSEAELRPMIGLQGVVMGLTTELLALESQKRVMECEVTPERKQGLIKKWQKVDEKRKSFLYGQTPNDPPVEQPGSAFSSYMGVHSPVSADSHQSFFAVGDLEASIQKWQRIINQASHDFSGSSLLANRVAGENILPTAQEEAEVSEDEGDCLDRLSRILPNEACGC